MVTVTNQAVYPWRCTCIIIRGAAGAGYVQRVTPGGLWEEHDGEPYKTVDDGRQAGKRAGRADRVL